MTPARMPITSDPNNYLASAFAFAADEAIKSGLLDRFLDGLAAEIKQRKKLLNRDKVPAKTADMIASGHQVWAWMNDVHGDGHWQIVGTGAKVTDEDLEFMRERREAMIQRGHVCGDYPAPCNCWP